MLRIAPKTVLVTVLALAAIVAGAPARAQDAYPTRTVRLVVGFGAGGPTDIPARHIADKLGTLLGQRLIVENKTGAAGMLATRDVLAQPADDVVAVEAIVVDGVEDRELERALSELRQPGHRGELYRIAW